MGGAEVDGPEPARTVELGQAPEVRIADGRLRGLWRGPSAAFLGVPVAAPTTGPGRFAAPRPVQAWEGVRDATRYGATAQRREPTVVTTIPEPSIDGDAFLNVNVFTPAPGDRGAGLPVLVWIHGGGFVAGSPASPWYDGVAFNRDGVVTVTISYRLGFDGFGWIEDAPANRGIVDQIAALTWVQTNIEAFGGDPTRVTIAGQSAGGCSVLTLLAAPGANGLFAGAIAQSPCLSRQRPDGARAASRRLARAIGVEAVTVADWRAVGEDAILDHEVEASFATMPQSELSVADLVRRFSDRSADLAGLGFGPVVDGETVIDLDTALATTHRDTPLLIGSTLNGFAEPGERLDRALVESELAAGGASAASIDGFVAEADRLGPGFLRNGLTAMTMFRIPTVQVASSRVAAGSGERTWLYDVRYRSVHGTSIHCIELPFVFDRLEAPRVSDLCGSQPPQLLADAMHGDWVRFVTDGSCPWPSADRGVAGARVYDEDVRTDPDAYRLEVELVH